MNTKASSFRGLLRQAVALLAILLFAPVAHSVSFDCSKAKSKSELLICSDPGLSSLDDELADLYRRAKATTSDPERFKTVSSFEWKWREQNCRDANCLYQWYEKRKQQLTAEVKGHGPSSGAPASNSPATVNIQPRLPKENAQQNRQDSPVGLQVTFAITCVSNAGADTTFYFSDRTFLLVHMLVTDGQAIAPMSEIVGMYRQNGDTFVHNGLALRWSDDFARVMKKPNPWETLDKAVESTDQYMLSGDTGVRKNLKTLNNGKAITGGSTSKCGVEKSEQNLRLAAGWRQTVPSRLLVQ